VSTRLGQLINLNIPYLLPEERLSVKKRRKEYYHEPRSVVTSGTTRLNITVSPLDQANRTKIAYHKTIYGRCLNQTTTNGLVDLTEKLNSSERHSGRAEEVGLGKAVRQGAKGLIPTYLKHRLAI
jgi:hypothetical protein